MDHRISKDMISSGLTPSGEKNQADLGKTQYGSAPSPSKLMDAYKSMYDKKEEVINEHHKKDADGNTIPHEDEEVNEGKIPAGLQAYLDKKKGKKEDKKEVKEDFDLFDVISGKLIEEGYSKKESYEIMANLTDEQLEEINEAVVTGTLATLGVLGKILAGGAAKAAVAGKGLAAAAKGGAMAVKGAATGAAKGAVSAGKGVMTGTKNLASKALTKVQNIAKPAPKVTSSGGDIVQGSDSGNKIKKFLKREGENVVRQELMKDRPGTNKTNKAGFATAEKTGIAASADLFDIVKGQLLDEGLSEEEIRDIMLTLTPDEIMKEMNQGPSTPVKNYGDSPDKPKILPNFGATRAKPRTTDKGTLIKGGKDTGKTPAQMSQEEYKNFDPKKPDPKQMAAQAKQEKIRQKNSDPMGVKNRNIGGQGLDPMDK